MKEIKQKLELDINYNNSYNNNENTSKEDGVIQQKTQNNMHIYDWSKMLSYLEILSKDD